MPPPYRSLRCHKRLNPLMWLLGYHCWSCYRIFRKTPWEVEDG